MDFSSLTTATVEFDLVVTGPAVCESDPETVARLARTYAEGGWPCRVEESGTALTAEFSAPSAGPPPWHLHRLTPVSATVVSTVGSGGATSFRF